MKVIKKIKIKIILKKEALRRKILRIFYYFKLRNESKEYRHMFYINKGLMNFEEYNKIIEKRLKKGGSCE